MEKQLKETNEVHALRISDVERKNHHIKKLYDSVKVANVNLQQVIDDLRQDAQRVTDNRNDLELKMMGWKEKETMYKDKISYLEAQVTLYTTYLFRNLC